MPFPFYIIVNCISVVQVDPVLSWGRKHEGVSELEVGTVSLIKFPSNVAESSKATVPESIAVTTQQPIALLPLHLAYHKLINRSNNTYLLLVACREQSFTLQRNHTLPMY